MKARSKRWQQFPERFGIEISLRRWASRVEWLAGDYDYLIYEEFDHMQDGRSKLEDMMETSEAMGFDDLLMWMVRLVDEVDEQFRRITTLDTNRLFAERSTVGTVVLVPAAIAEGRGGVGVAS